MRLWSKQLIEYLPGKQLLSQWREIIAIIGNIKKRGHPNHILVNKVIDHPLNHFSSYSKVVTEEMGKRGYKVSKERIEYVYQFCGDPDIEFDDIYSDWHDEEYIKICLYNLYEKHIRGGITKEEWGKLITIYGYLLK